MKRICLVWLCTALSSIAVFAQSLDRAALSSGGISSDTLSATIGEVFVFSLNGTGISLDAGSQSDENFTGGINVSIRRNDTNEIKLLAFPNPVSEHLNLQINGLKNETLCFQVLDGKENIVLEQKTDFAGNLFRLKVDQLPAGIYYIRAFTNLGGNMDKIKFIKL